MTPPHLHIMSPIHDSKTSFSEESRELNKSELILDCQHMLEFDGRLNVDHFIDWLQSIDHYFTWHTLSEAKRSILLL